MLTAKLTAIAIYASWLELALFTAWDFQPSICDVIEIVPVCAKPTKHITSSAEISIISFFDY